MFHPISAFPANVRSLGFKSTATTGSISAGSNQLTVVSASGFTTGDPIIIAVGGESGVGARGTKGVGGTWPALSYADNTARDADTSQAEGTYAWVEASGDVFRFVSGAWSVDPSANYYTTKANPKALVTTISGIAGNVVTLANNAVAAATNANIYFDNLTTFNSAVALGGARVSLRAPSGSYAVSGELLLDSRPLWEIAGAGKAATTILSPDGTTSARIRVINSQGVIVRDLHLLGNARMNGYGLAVTETSIPQGSGYPRAIYFNTCVGGRIQDCKVTDAFQFAAGAQNSSDVWAYRVECIATAPLLTYIQWLFLWANTTGGGAVDCSVTSPYLTAGFEGFESQGVSFIRCIGVNATFAMNSSGGFLIDAPQVTVQANTQYAGSAFSEHNPVINIDANIDADSGLLALGGTIRNPTIVQEGYINASNDSLIGIVVNANNPNVTISGGYPGSPGQGGLIDYQVNWLTPSTLGGPQGIVSDNAAITVSGIRVKGTTKDATWGNIKAAAGSVMNCVADRITGSASQSGNQTNAQYGP